jgi:hypothetical protein
MKTPNEHYVGFWLKQELRDALLQAASDTHAGNVSALLRMLVSRYIDSPERHSAHELTALRRHPVVKQPLIEIRQAELRRLFAGQADGPAAASAVPPATA